MAGNMGVCAINVEPCGFETKGCVKELKALLKRANKLGVIKIKNETKNNNGLRIGVVANTNVKLKN